MLKNNITAEINFVFGGNLLFIGLNANYVLEIFFENNIKLHPMLSRKLPNLAIFARFGNDLFS